MTNPWYETVDARIPLTQGDLITGCPLLTWNVSATSADAQIDASLLQQAVAVFRADVVVMTQACDLEHDKVQNVILCPHVSLADYRVSFEEELRAGGQNPTAKAWKRQCDDICDGYVWNLVMLAADRQQTSTFPHRVIDFHEVFTLPRAFLDRYLAQADQPRLRLLPPYREYLSQAFARFFMRVGLPTPVAPAW